MDYEFFHNDEQGAKKFYESFLTVSKKGLESTFTLLSKEGIVLDYSIESAKDLLKWTSKHLGTVELKADNTLPEWILNTEDYKENLFDFDHTTRILLLRAAYYLGESFVKYNPKLSWSMGRKNTMFKNMPVIKGFIKKMEMSPIVVSENVMSRVYKTKKLEEVDSVIDYWKTFCP